MTNRKTSVRLVAILIVVCFALMFIMTACKEACPPHIDLNNDGICDKCNGEMPKAVSITLSEKDGLHSVDYDGQLVFVVTVENADDKSYTWSYDTEGVVTVSNNVLTVVNGESMVLDRTVVVTATANADSTKTASWSVSIKAPRQEGQVGHLTSDMILSLGNSESSITLDGKVTDIYINANQPYLNSETYYDFLVKMEKDYWYGEWSAENGNKVSNLYGHGDTIVKDADGKSGYALFEYYVDINNTVQSKAVTNYESKYVTWDSQHYWNHLDQLNIKNFEYRDDLSTENVHEIYEYVYPLSVGSDTIEENPDLWLMTYLVYSMTPMLADTFEHFYLVVENGKITNIIAETVKSVSYDSDGSTPLETAYSRVDIKIEDLGNTRVDMPKVYEGDNYTSILTAALTEMAGATNYSFSAEETQTYGVSSDVDDYEMSSTASGQRVSKSKLLANGTSASGTVGLMGWIDGTTALFCRTGKYSYAMDDKIYWREYYGYQTIDENHYDYFKYVNVPSRAVDTYLDDNSDITYTPTYVGQQRLNGTIFDKLPAFKMAAELFSCDPKGSDTYMFVLKEGSITREVALQLGLYYAEDAYASSYNNLYIVVKGGHITEVCYPYDISGNYIGYITVKYYNIGTTDLTTLTGDGSNPMADYVARAIPQSWSEMSFGGTGIYYREDGSFTYSATVDECLPRIFDAKTISDSNFIQYKYLVNAWGDSFSGPWFDDVNTHKTDSDGKDIYLYYLGLTYRTEMHDGNSHITDEMYWKLINDMKTELSKYGFTETINPKIVDTSGGVTGYSDKVYAMENDDLDIIIIIENNRTRNFWINIYKLSDYLEYKG